MLLRSLEATPLDKLHYQLGEDTHWHQRLFGFLREAAGPLAAPAPAPDG